TASRLVSVSLIDPDLPTQWLDIRKPAALISHATAASGQCIDKHLPIHRAEENLAATCLCQEVRSAPNARHLADPRRLHISNDLPTLDNPVGHLRPLHTRTKEQNIITVLCRAHPFGKILLFIIRTAARQ